MSPTSKNFAHVLAAPVLAAGLLAGLAWEKQDRPKPEDATPYHQRAFKAIDELPYIIGYWTGRDFPVPEAAQKLLKPNIIRSRQYTENRPGAPTRQASVLVVQCRDSRDMIGHYPPICYTSFGDAMESAKPGDWRAGNTTVPGTEYCFTTYNAGERLKKWVRNFLIVPGTGVHRDMSGVLETAGDYDRRFFGAAQFQVVMYGEVSEQERDEIFAELMAPVLRIMDVVGSTGADPS